MLRNYMYYALQYIHFCQNLENIIFPKFWKMWQNLKKRFNLLGQNFHETFVLNIDETFVAQH